MITKEQKLIIEPLGVYLFVGYYLSKKRYKCYHPTFKKFFMHMNVTFHENPLFSQDLQGEPFVEYKEFIRILLSSYTKIAPKS